MPNRSSKHGRDINSLAYAIVQKATDPQPDPQSEKNPAAVALGRLGGLKGGRARAKALSVAQRSRIAKNAAKKRWSKGN